MQKLSFTAPCIALSLLLLAACVTSNTPRKVSILIDYDDEVSGNGIHETSIRNGGFEIMHPDFIADSQKEGTRAFSKKGGGGTYKDSTDWSNFKGNSGDPLLTIGTPYEGKRAAVFGATNDRPKPSTPSQATGYFIKPGDIFNVSVWYADSGNSTKEGDHGQVVLFTLEADREIEIGRFDMRELSSNYIQCNGSTEPIGIRSEAIGNELYIKFVYVDTDGNRKGRMRLDAITLSVASLE